MNKLMKLLMTVSISITMLLSGCMTSSSDKKTGTGEDKGRPGVAVKVFQYGKFELLGRAIEKADLPRELKKTGADKGRAIILEAQKGVSLQDLVKVREFLVLHNIPNVTIVLARTAVSYESDSIPAQNEKLPDNQ